VRVLVDECVDWRLSREIVGHADLRPLVPELLRCMPTAKRGAVTYVGEPESQV